MKIANKIIFNVYVYIFILLFYKLIICLFNFNRISYNEHYMINIPIQTQTNIFGVLYNSQTMSIFVFGYSNNSKIDIYPCIIYSKNIHFNCILKYKCRINSYFMYELEYNWTNKPKTIKIREKLILVQYSSNQKNRNTVCITKMINYTASNYLIQMIESYRFFGITNFIIYYTSSSSSVIKILKYYQTLNILTLIKWNCSYETTFLKKYVYGQKWKYNDCYYRNAGNKGMMVFTDLDEIIWPVSGKNIRSILNEYNQMNSDIYVFKTKIYLKEYSSITYDRYIHVVNDFDLFQIHNACLYRKRFLRKYIINNCNYLKVLSIHDIERSVKNVRISYISEKFGYIRHSRRVRADLFKKCKNWKNYYDSEELIKIVQMKVNVVKNNVKRIN